MIFSEHPCIASFEDIEVVTIEDWPLSEAGLDTGGQSAIEESIVDVEVVSRSEGHHRPVGRIVVSRHRAQYRRIHEYRREQHPGHGRYRKAVVFNRHRRRYVVEVVGGDRLAKSN